MKKILLFILGIAIIFSFFSLNRLAKKASAQSVIFQDDFETDLSQWQITATPPNSASISTEMAQRGAKSLKLHYVESGSPVVVKREFSSPQNGIISVWFYDNLKNPSGSGVAISNVDNTQTVSVGVHPGYTDSYFYRASENKPWMNINSKIRRINGWHKFELVSTPRGSYAKIDGMSLAWLPAEKKFGDNKEWSSTAVNTNLRAFSQIQIFSTWGALGEYFYDLVEVQTLPSPPATNLEKEYYFVKLFLKSYQSTDLSPVINHPGGSHTYRGLLYTALAHAVRFRKEGNQADLARAESLINQVVDRYQYWGKSWQSPVITHNMGLATWLLWNNLSQETKLKVKEKMVTDANYWLPSTDWPANRYIGNSAGEENAWFASGFTLTALMFPNEENSSAWEAKAKKLAFHSLTTNVDNAYTDGSKTQTLYPDYRLENHDINPHPHYAAGTVGLLGEGALVYFKTGKEIPSEFKHNVAPVINKTLEYINLNTLQIDFTNIGGASCLLPFLRAAGKDDWLADATWFSQDALAFLLNQNLLPNGNSLYQNLLDYEITITSDFNAFPVLENAVINTVYLGAPIDCQAGYHELTDGYKWFMNGLLTMRHIIALIYQDPTLTLPPTSLTISLSPGWNEMPWPDSSGYTAKTALEDIDDDCGAGTGVVIATKKKDWLENYVKDYGGENFSLQNNQNYFIKVSRDCSWGP